MAVYMIDYENVSVSGLVGLEQLTVNDIVYIFYTENADRLTFSAHRKLLECAAQIRYYKAEAGGKNALDFQIVTYLGYLIHENSKADYHLITKDSGFDSVITFWQKQNISVSRMADLSSPCSCEQEKEMMEKLLELLSPEDVKNVCAMVQKYKTKQGLNNALMKKYDNKKTSEIYRVIKPYIADKKAR